MGSHDGPFLGGAAFSPASRIRARAWRFGEAECIDASFLIAASALWISARSLFDLMGCLPRRPRHPFGLPKPGLAAWEQGFDGLSPSWREEKASEGC